MLVCIWLILDHKDKISYYSHKVRVACVACSTL